MIIPDRLQVVNAPAGAGLDAACALRAVASAAERSGDGVVTLASLEGSDG